MTHSNLPPISAIVLAAGRSTRMGQPKMALPWGDDTVIGKVVKTLICGGAARVVVVTGGARTEVEQALSRLPTDQIDRVLTVYNPLFANGEMITSLQVGLGKLLPTPDRACLLALGDQPQIESATVHAVLTAYAQTQAPIVVPSYSMRRGHPWLVDRCLWDELLATPEHPTNGILTLRDFLNHHDADIHYAPVNTASILADLDTPDEYHRQAP